MLENVSFTNSSNYLQFSNPQSVLLPLRSAAFLLKSLQLPLKLKHKKESENVLQFSCTEKFSWNILGFQLEQRFVSRTRYTKEEDEEEEKSTTLSSCRTLLQQLRPKREEKCDKNKFKDEKLFNVERGGSEEVKSEGKLK